MTAIAGAFSKLRAALNVRPVGLLVRAGAIVSMSFGAAFGFIAAIGGEAAQRDTHPFAIGVAALFGAACGGIALLLSRLKTLRDELAALRARNEELADRNWELKEAEERTRSLV